MSDEKKRMSNMTYLLAAGMVPEEAENFLRKGNTVLTKVVQIPGEKAARVIPRIARLGIINGAVTLKIGIEESREEALVAELEENCGQKVVKAQDFTGETERRTAPIGIDVDPSKVN